MGGLAGELLPSSFAAAGGGQSQGGAQPLMAQQAYSPVAIVKLQNPRLLLAPWLTYTHWLMLFLSA